MELREVNSHEIDEVYPDLCPKDPNRIKGGEVQNFVQKKNLAQVREVCGREEGFKRIWRFAKDLQFSYILS
jgi:hypothetical protein